MSFNSSKSSHSLSPSRTLEPMTPCCSYQAEILRQDEKRGDDEGGHNCHCQCCTRVL